MSDLHLGDKKRRILQVILVLVILVCLAVLGVYFYNQNKQKDKIEDIREEVIIEDDEFNSKIDFEKLWEENEDVIAWIEIPGTKVSYPILQSAEDEEEDYYLDHNFDRSKGYPGAIYTQKLNQKNFDDPITVIYGHNMKNGDMFGDLRDIYMDEERFKEAQEILIHLPNKVYHYKVFAANIYDDRLILDYYNQFLDEGSYETFVEEIRSLAKSNGREDADVTWDGKERIITLSTCVAVDTERFLVNAVLTDEEE